MRSSSRCRRRLAVAVVDSRGAVRDVRRQCGRLHRRGFRDPATQTCLTGSARSPGLARWRHRRTERRTGIAFDGPGGDRRAVAGSSLSGRLARARAAPPCDGLGSDTLEPSGAPVRLSTIALRNIRRHLSRSALMVLVIAAAVAVVTTLYLTARSAENDLANKVDEFGPNLIVTPRSQELPLVYGGVQLGGLTYDVRSARPGRRSQDPHGQGRHEHQPCVAESGGRDERGRDGPFWSTGSGGTSSSGSRSGGSCGARRRRRPTTSYWAATWPRGCSSQPGGDIRDGRPVPVRRRRGTRADRDAGRRRHLHGPGHGRGGVGTSGEVSFIEVSAWCAELPHRAVDRAALGGAPERAGSRRCSSRSRRGGS